MMASSQNDAHNNKASQGQMIPEKNGKTEVNIYHILLYAPWCLLKHLRHMFAGLVGMCQGCPSAMQKNGTSRKQEYSEEEPLVTHGNVTHKGGQKQ